MGFRGAPWCSAVVRCASRPMSGPLALIFHHSEAGPTVRLQLPIPNMSVVSKRHPFATTASVGRGGRGERKTSRLEYGKRAKKRRIWVRISPFQRSVGFRGDPWGPVGFRGCWLCQSPQCPVRWLAYPAAVLPSWVVSPIHLHPQDLTRRWFRKDFFIFRNSWCWDREARREENEKKKKKKKMWETREKQVDLRARSSLFNVPWGSVGLRGVPRFSVVPVAQCLVPWLSYSTILSRAPHSPAAPNT